MSETMVNESHRENKQNKKTKVSEPMGNESHREYPRHQNKQDFRINGSGSLSFVLKYCFLFVWYSRWLSLPIGSEILVFLIVFVFSMAFVTHWFWHLGFFVCCVFSMVLVTHWFWNLGCLGFIHGFGLPIDPFWLTCARWKCCFAIAKQRIILKPCIWPRRNVCFDKWCFQSIKHYVFLKWSVSFRRNTFFHHRICQKSGHHRLPFSLCDTILCYYTKHHIVYYHMISHILWYHMI